MKHYSNEQLNTLKGKMERVGIKTPLQAILNLIKEEELNIESIKFSQAYRGETLYLNEATYLILPEYQAEKQARESLEELFEEHGLSIFEVNPYYYMDKETLRALMEDDLYVWLEMAGEEDIEDRMEALGVEDEDALIEALLNKYNPLDYLLDFYEEDDLVKILLTEGGINTEELFDDLISWYGRGHQIACYDEIEIELGSFEDESYYAYRMA